jgi:hypothetical protein
MLKLSVSPRKVLDVVKGDETCVRNCEMTLHVGEPWVDSSVIGNHFMHSGIPLLLNVLFFSHPFFWCVRTYTLFPLSTHSKKGLFCRDLLHNFLSESLFMLTNCDRMLLLILWIFNLTCIRTTGFTLLNRFVRINVFLFNYVIRSKSD